MNITEAQTERDLSLSLALPLARANSAHKLILFIWRCYSALAHTSVSIRTHAHFEWIQTQRERQREKWREEWKNERTQKSIAQN